MASCWDSHRRFGRCLRSDSVRSMFWRAAATPYSAPIREAVTATVMHGLKIVVYQQAISLDVAFWALAAVLGLGMLLGTWIGKHVIEGLPPERFQRYVSIVLVLVALYMLIHG
jgi:uncharacterized protein